jgi:hypothetical protein
VSGANLLTVNNEPVGTVLSLLQTNQSNPVTALVAENATPVGPNLAELVPAWFVDPQNVSGLASDANAGTTRAAPLRHKAEIARRWGSWSPALDGALVPGSSVVVTMMSADVDGSDPWLAVPSLLNSCFLTLTADLPAPSATGSLLVVTPKVRAANQALQTTFTTTTGAFAVGQLLDNTTRGSRAWVQADLGGGSFRISQPLTKVASVLGLLDPVADNTWANGDAITAHVPMAVCVGATGALAIPQTNASFSNGNQLWLLTMNDFGSPTPGTGTIVFLAPNATVCAECRADATPNGGPFCDFFNCYVVGPSGDVGVGFQFKAGVCAYPFGLLVRSNFFEDPILSGANMVLENCQVFQGAYVPTGIVLTCTQGIQTQFGVLYGGGTLNAQSGSVLYSSTAVSTFPLAGGLQLNGVAAGYSFATAAGVTTVHGGITLTAAHLDAAAGAAGFGGYAQGGGASFSRGGMQP